MSSVTAVDISAGGLEYQRMKMEAIAANIANANVPRNARGEIFNPVDVAVDSDAVTGQTALVGDAVLDVIRPRLVQISSAPKMVYEPENPLANPDGYMEYPDVDSTQLMLKMMETTRAYEANLKALAAERLMILKTIEMG